MIAKLEWTQSNTQQNIEQLQNITMGVTTTTNQQQQNHRPRTDRSQIHWWVLNAFYWHQIFALEVAVLEAKKCQACMEDS